MEQQSEQNNQPEHISVGQALRAAREHAGLSLNEVADRLKLSLRQLDAIERDDFEALPGPTFVRGFVRNYARFLEIDPAPLMEALDVHFPSAVKDVVNLSRDESSQVSTDESDDEGNGNKWLVLSLVGIVAAASAVWIFGHSNDQQPDVTPVIGQQTASDLAMAASAPPILASAPVVAVAKVASAAVASAPHAVDASAAAAKALAAKVLAAKLLAAKTLAAKAASAAVAKPAAAALGEGSGKLTVSVSESAWVAVVDAQGNKLVFSTVEPGSPREVTGVPPFKVRVGNAAKVTMSYNGQAVSLADHTHGTTATFELK
jgi:cytoskeleton protein RodZ